MGLVAIFGKMNLHRRTQSYDVFFRGIMLTYAVLLGLAAADRVDASTGFTRADGLTYFDRGGAWHSGTGSELSPSNGHTLALTLESTSNDPVEGITISLDLPPGVVALPATAVVPGSSGSPLATTVGQTTTFDLSNVVIANKNDTLTLSIAVYPDATFVGDEMTATWHYDSATLSGTPSIDITVPVQDGNVLFSNQADATSVKAGETTTFTVAVSNTGAGGLFEVTLDQNSIAPANGTYDLELVSFTQLTGHSNETAQTAAVAAGDAEAFVLPFLEPGGEWRVQVTALATGCGDITSIAKLTDRITTDADANTTSRVRPATMQVALSQPQWRLPAAPRTSRCHLAPGARPSQ